MSQRSLRILITNNTLVGRGGSELYVRDVALAMLRRGHRPVVCSTALGEVADELRGLTIPVIDNPAALSEAPDVIHGQHHLDAMMAMLHFPRVPALYFCHGWLPWEELPPLFPAVRRYVAVDDLCRERLLSTPGVVPEQVRVLLNFVDLVRFQPRGPLPERPRSALIFSNYASEETYVGVIRAACHACGIERVDVIGASAGHSVARPEALLPQYDLVFAKARAALEAMAVGCAVIVADYAGLGGLVTPTNMQAMRQLNFGARTMQAAVMSEAALVAEITRYQAADVERVSAWVRAAAGLEQAMDALEMLYGEVVAESIVVRAGDPDEDLKAAAAYMQVLAPVIKSRVQADRKAHQLEEWSRHAAAETGHKLQALEGQLRQAASERERIEAEVANMTQAVAERDAVLASIHSSRAWRLVTLYRKCKSWLIRR